jgi:hypothetical protein
MGRNSACSSLQIALRSNERARKARAPSTWSALRLLAVNDPVLRSYVPTDVYSPFDGTEAATLSTFAVDTKAFVHSALFKNRDLALFPPDELYDPQQLTTAGEEAVRSVTGLFRSLYEPQEAASFDVVVNLLCRHAIARQSDAGVEVLDFFRALKKWRNEELRRRASRTADGTLRRRDLISVFLYGAYLHKEPSKVERLESLSFAMKMEFLNTIQLLRLLYDATERELIQPILDTPLLISPSPSFR